MENKNIDQYTKNIIQNAGLESPSPEFLNNIMSMVSHRVESKISYTPLISKKIWLLILIIGSAILLGYFITPESLSIMNLNLSDRLLPTLTLPQLTVSSISLYSIVFLSMFLFQIPILKYYLERRFVS